MLVGLYVGQPLLDAGRRRRPRRTVRLGLLVQKDALLAQIQDLDFDFETGKLPEASYRGQRAELVAEAKSVLKQLDRLDEVTKSDDDLRPDAEFGQALALDADIEAAVTRIRQGRWRVAKPVREPAGDNGREKRPVGDGQNKFCPQCGRSTDPGDKFCAACGYRLTEPRVS